MTTRYPCGSPAEAQQAAELHERMDARFGYAPGQCWVDYRLQPPKEPPCASSPPTSASQ